jgi:hypothetical protein
MLRTFDVFLLFPSNFPFVADAAVYRPLGEEVLLATRTSRLSCGEIGRFDGKTEKKASRRDERVS